MQDLTRTVDALEGAVTAAKKETHDSRGEALSKETQLATIVNQLQAELEKRLTELGDARAGLDGSRREAEQLKGAMAQQKDALASKEREYAQVSQSVSQLGY